MWCSGCCYFNGSFFCISTYQNAVCCDCSDYQCCYFNAEGEIVVFEKVRTEKKAMKRLVALAEDNREMELSILHTNAPEKAEAFKSQLEAQGITVSSVESLCVVIATHLVEGALVLGLTPKFTK